MIKLIGVTKHGKNRIHEHGNVWKVLPVTIPNLTTGKLFIQSVKTGDKRWLTEDFKVEI